ncbi:MAG: hypothetical protein J3K34DRAFT_128428 [Monoraphidium minutum]|nr:MAG: hypothetical protein J3K34DRAFT_128428 [Monoraphidium minutum]
MRPLGFTRARRVCWTGLRRQGRRSAPPLVAGRPRPARISPRRAPRTRGGALRRLASYPPVAAHPPPSRAPGPFASSVAPHRPPRAPRRARASAHSCPSGGAAAFTPPPIPFLNRGLNRVGAALVAACSPARLAPARALSHKYVCHALTTTTLPCARAPPSLTTPDACRPRGAARPRTPSRRGRALCNPETACPRRGGGAAAAGCAPPPPPPRLHHHSMDTCECVAPRRACARRVV